MREKSAASMPEEDDLHDSAGWNRLEAKLMKINTRADLEESLSSYNADPDWKNARPRVVSPLKASTRTTKKGRNGRIPPLGYGGELATITPPTDSMFESALYCRLEAPEPRIIALEQVREALGKDADEQRQKYGAEDPDSKSARYNVPLPRSPQHDKYSWMRVKEAHANDEESEADDALQSSVPANMRFNAATLRKWFKDIDREDTGLISTREAIVAIRRHQAKGMMDWLCREDPSKPPSVITEPGMQFLTMSREITDPVGLGEGKSEKKAKKNDLHRVRKRMAEINPNPPKPDCIEIDDFIDFFRRAGLLLEYKAKNSKLRATVTYMKERAQETKFGKEEAPKGASSLLPQVKV